MSTENSISKDAAFSPLGHDKIRELAPSVFTEEKASRTSHIYAKTSTIKIIEDLIGLGWFAVRAIERKSKITQGYQKHVIWFRNPDVMILTKEGEVEAYPEICLVNSHDGLTAFQLSLALYRVACSNGLVFQSDKLSNFRIIHKGYNFSELEKIVTTITERVPAMISKVDEMKALILDTSTVMKYVQDAVKVRERYSQGTPIRVIAEDFSTPLRDSDIGDDLWTVYNRVQEKLLKGGFLNIENGRMTKQITYLDKILWVNKDLFDLTEQYFNQYKSTAPVDVEGIPAYDQWQTIKQMVREKKSIPEICIAIGVSKRNYYRLLSSEQRDELDLIRTSLK